MFECEKDIILTIKPQDPDSNWITIDEHGTIISEGKTPTEAIEIARSVTDNFTVIFVPKKGISYIF